MWRALVFIGLLCLAAFAAVWLADHPGSLAITWQGREYTMSLAVGLVGIVVIAMVLSFVWAVIRFMTRLPTRMGENSRTRRQTRGQRALSRGIIAIGAGDIATARRYAGEAERLIGSEPMTLLLKAQTAQAAGDRHAADAAFRRMLDHSETRVLGLRGLFVEARRRGDTEAARSSAEEAARIAPSVAWANDAVLEAYSADGDWASALRSVERLASRGLSDKSASRRQRAVLHTANALAREQASDSEAALASALEAIRLAPDLVPAAALAGRILSRRGDLKRAAKIIETAWQTTPHPDLAAAYLNLRPGDSALDRLHRAETLARLSSWSPESRLAIARAAIEAREFHRAREVLRPLLDERPTMRVCLMMAELEQAQGAAGRVREWLARAARAARDKAWIADGIVSETWAPLSPVTGRLDAFVWDTPPDVLGRPTGGEPDFLEQAMREQDHQDSMASLAPPEATSLPAEPVQPSPPAASAPAALDGTPPVEHAPAPPIVTDMIPAEPAKPMPLPFEPKAESAAEPILPPGRAEPARDGPANGVGPGPAKAGQEPVSVEPAAVVFPFAHPPDDPGPDKREEKRDEKRSLFRIGA